MNNRQGRAQNHFLFRFSEGPVPATTSEVFSYTLISVLERVEERPVYDSREGQMCLLLYPIDASETLDRFLLKLQEKVALAANLR